MAKMSGKNIGISLVMGVTLLLVLAGLLVLVNTSNASESPDKAPTVEGSASNGAKVGEAVPMQPTHVACDFREWLGQTAEMAEMAVKATGRPYRMLPPGSAMTMDYRADRVNIETDGKEASSKVTKVSCG